MIRCSGNIQNSYSGPRTNWVIPVWSHLACDHGLHLNWIHETRLNALICPYEPQIRRRWLDEKFYTFHTICCWHLWTQIVPQSSWEYRTSPLLTSLRPFASMKWRQSCFFSPVPLSVHFVFPLCREISRDFAHLMITSTNSSSLAVSLSVLTLMTDSSGAGMGGGVSLQVWTIWIRIVSSNWTTWTRLQKETPAVLTTPARSECVHCNI